MTDTPDPSAEIPVVQPALSEKEWREQIAHDVGFSRTSGHGEIAAHVYASLAKATDGGLPDGVTEALEIHWSNAERTTQVWDRPKLAALCLYGTPEGFTHAEYQALASCIPSEPDSYEETMSPPAETLALAESALAKIRALLPPKSHP